VASGLRLRFVRFSGQALTQGVENTRIDGVPVRIYSVANTIADCLKYRKKLVGNLAGIKCCEKVSLEGNVANKDFGISQKYAGSGNWSRPHILWLRVHELQGTWLADWCFLRNGTRLEGLIRRDPHRAFKGDEAARSFAED